MELNFAKHASGDNNTIKQPVDIKQSSSPEVLIITDDIINTKEDKVEKLNNQSEISPQLIDENEKKLEERITQCKNIIASLKLELNEEKMKLKMEAKDYQLQTIDTPVKVSSNINYVSEKRTDFTNFYSTNMYSVFVDSKLNCDEHLMEYEKQLERYQITLNMAQIEKKNAIRKQMLAKAFKLKLMEVENQCNIELLRIKQSLQCLEPLKMIVEKWQTNSNDNDYDLNNFQLIPRYPELNAASGSDIITTSSTDEFQSKTGTSNLSSDKN
ncbi:uncharacterized protein LOC120626378 [Pararge aegeria]|uniref:Jg4607 protein n=1 Tax=Pararge aegeria aegeria TaxID=348720 RepID=A0A8S4RS33_9NEOP|nr:uncharacterized protein LOC120626378 [Pararge aegeria]CAH2239767.1 jg4607 [Pararge aegeria aegeria]